MAYSRGSMVQFFGILPIFLVVPPASAGFHTIRRQDSINNNGINLAVHPECGTLGGNFTDVNVGIDPSSIRTIVTFGVCSLIIEYYHEPTIL